jgi:hypothetical protein
MSDTLQHELAEPTDVRFGTRSLLVAMTAVAITIAALGRVLRYFPEDVRSPLVVHWAIYFVMLGAAMAYLARKRYVSEKRAGPIVFVLPVFSYYSPRVPWIGRVLGGAFLAICGSILWFALSFVVAFDDQNQFMVLLNVYAYLAVYLSSLGLSYL